MIRLLLLYRIEVTDDHPVLMLACLGAMVVLAGVLEGVMP